MHLILNINKLFRYNMNDTKGKNYVYQKLCLYIKCSHGVNGLGKQKNIKTFNFISFHALLFW